MGAQVSYSSVGGQTEGGDREVWDTQSTFIKGRNIFEGWRVASGVLDEMRQNGEDVVFKIDFEKAYDCFDWNFLWFVLTKMGFGGRWVRWMKRYVMYARVLVLVNESEDGAFSMERELRQGF